MFCKALQLVWKRDINQVVLYCIETSQHDRLNANVRDFVASNESKHSESPKWTLDWPLTCCGRVEGINMILDPFSTTMAACHWLDVNIKHPHWLLGSYYCVPRLYQNEMMTMWCFDYLSAIIWTRQKYRDAIFNQSLINRGLYPKILTRSGFHRVGLHSQNCWVKKEPNYVSKRDRLPHGSLWAYF